MATPDVVKIPAGVSAAWRRYKVYLADDDPILPGL